MYMATLKDFQHILRQFATSSTYSEKWKLKENDTIYDSRYQVERAAVQLISTVNAFRWDLLRYELH
ncbi:hypothetical protein C8Q74DRAFT_588586 [Fomes fomentarius]|nr:hypothetical protein C8Q74DRAFT_588586 [Fomes fomentarius]